jgi:transposase
MYPQIPITDAGEKRTILLEKTAAVVHYRKGGEKKTLPNHLTEYCTFFLKKYSILQNVPVKAFAKHKITRLQNSHSNQTKKHAECRRHRCSSVQTCCC